MTAEELLMMSDDFETYIADDALVIDPESRTILTPVNGLILGVESDKEAERVQFVCPRFVGDNIDLSELQIRTIYQNANGEKDFRISTDVSVDGDNIRFSWLLSRKVTKYKGKVKFIVCAIRTQADGTTKNEWNTTLAEGISLEGLEVDILEEEFEEPKDIVLQLLGMLDEKATEIMKEIDKYLEKLKIDNNLDVNSENAIQNKVVAKQFNRLSEEIEEQKEVPMTSINPYKMNLKNYDVVINEGRYVTGYNTTTLIPMITQNNTYDYDVIDMSIKHDNCIVTVPYDSTQNVGQAFVLYTEGVQANNATPNHVNNKQVGVIEVSTDSYTVNLNASKLNYERVAFTVPKGRRDFYFKKIDDGELGELIDEKISNNIVIAPVNMFYSIGAIGDSYTAGSALSSDGVTWQDVTELSWIATMAKRAGIYYSNYGRGGATTKSYITDKLPSVLSGQAKDLYFIALGINDYMQNISVGAISDIKNDYTQNGETFYGYYGSIIAQVQAHAPKSKIVLVKIWTNGTSKTPYDNAIIEIASHFGLPVINPFDDIYFNSSLYLDNMVSGHPTAMGYACMGLAMERLFSKCVIENPNYFKYATIG